MCAGATVWSTLTRFGTRSADRVGIMGVGGLGHIAIKLAAALGYYAILLSTSETKREEAIKFRVSEFHVFRSGRGPPEVFKPIEHLLLCASGDVDYFSLLFYPLLRLIRECWLTGVFNSLLALTDTPSIIYPLTATFELSKIPTLELYFKGVRIQGSLVASRNSIRTLLDFASKNKITPTIMTFPLTIAGIEEAMDTLREGKLWCRGVLVRE